MRSLVRIQLLDQDIVLTNRWARISNKIHRCVGNDFPLTVLVSQLVEKFAHNEKVVGSSPTEDTKFKINFMKYRKKPVVIEAFRFSMDSFQELHELLSEFMKDADVDINYLNDGKIYIETLEGVMTAREGDWIIKGINGEFYPCKPDIFEKTYELVE